MKLIATLFLLVTVLTFFSCSKKQDNPVTPVNNSIAFTGIKEADSVKGTLSAQITISGNQPQKIEVFANDSLIATASKAPYTLQWNTLGVVNGNYKIKIVASYESGKQAEVSLNVIVKNILITLEVDPQIYGQLYTNVMYIVTDSDGTVLNSLKYNGTDKHVEIAGTHASLSSRCAVFEVRTDKRSTWTNITGYMSIPKGSIWDLRVPLNPTNPSNAATNLTFSNLPSFNRLTLSSDVYGLTYINPQNIYPSTGYGFTPTGKLFAQYVDGNNNGHYAFINVDTTLSNSTINLSAGSYKPSLKNTIIINGASVITPSIYGKNDPNYDSYYLIDNPVFLSPNADYFYPGSVFTAYKASVLYYCNNMQCITTYLGLPPQNIAPFAASATVTSSALNNFKFTSQGSIDYYAATFQTTSLTNSIQIYSPVTHDSFQFPDILKFTNLSATKSTDYKLGSFTMFKTSGFNESRMLSYYNPNYFSQLSLSSQSATQFFQ
ncbi:MAG: hypothetical protein JWR54_1239 [Mucilaginibacter sp.]|nr:hypothetical protein [Mucilaginibacter sp.]